MKTNASKKQRETIKSLQSRELAQKAYLNGGRPKVSLPKFSWEKNRDDGHNGIGGEVRDQDSPKSFSAKNDMSSM